MRAARVASSTPGVPSGQPRPERSRASAIGLARVPKRHSVRYTLGCWPRLVRFLDDPAIWLDSNRTERGLRGRVVGRRNHFGSESRRGTEAAAILYACSRSRSCAAPTPPQATLGRKIILRFRMIFIFFSP